MPASPQKPGQQAASAPPGTPAQDKPGGSDAPPAPAAPPAAVEAPAATTPGRLWEALANLSIGRRVVNTADRAGEMLADIVHRGETVWLTDEVAHRFLTGHRVPMIRPASESGTPAPVVTARQAFGRRPAAAQFDALPDPAGATTVMVNDPTSPESHPEASDPLPGATADAEAARGL